MDKKTEFRPHVVILGAGASRAAFPDGDANRRKLPVMNDLTGIIGLSELLKPNAFSYNGNFEEQYSFLYETAKNKDLLREIEDKIYKYFSEMRLPDSATIYDRLVLSLNKNDIIATFNWDPLLLMAYKRNASLKNLPKILFLHGNTFVGVCFEHKQKGYTDTVCGICKKPLTKTELLYPIKNKDYEKNLFVKDEWEAFKDALTDAFIITVFGYGAPKTDKAAIETMKKAWDSNKANHIAQTEIIDLKNETELNGIWKGFIGNKYYDCFSTYYDSWIEQHPRRTVKALIMGPFQQAPLENIQFSKTNDLGQLQDEVARFIRAHEVEN